VAIDHRPFLGENPLVLAFIIIENGRSCYFQQKWGLCYPSILLKMVVDVILTKNKGCVAIEHRPEAHTPHPTYVSLP
jgi:hypothetical protein